MNQLRDRDEDDDEDRIKEELFLILSFFILTLEHRQNRIRYVIMKNTDNLMKVISKYRDKTNNS